VLRFDEDSGIQEDRWRLTARHAACLLRGKRRAGLRRWQPDTPGNAPAATATKRTSPPAQCPRCLRSALPPPFSPALRHGTLRPKTRGQGLAAPGGLRRAGLERRRMLRNRLGGFVGFAFGATLPATLERPAFAIHGFGVRRENDPVDRFPASPLRCRLRGGTGRPGIRPARRAAVRRWAFPPACVCGFVRRPVPPAQPGSVVGNST
jgi:hypothetical protein